MPQELSKQLVIMEDGILAHVPVAREPDLFYEIYKVIDEGLVPAGCLLARKDTEFIFLVINNCLKAFEK